MKSLYLLINLSCISVPLIASFHPKLSFYKEWRAAWPALILTAVAFLTWDHLFTNWGVWGFNDAYVLGLSFLGLPLEEMLFFICIPYACLFTYFAIKQHLQLTGEFRPLTLFLSLSLLALGVVFSGKLYTSTTFLLTSLLLLFHLHPSRSLYLAPFYLSYIVILLPFFLSNGILTGAWIPEEVVWYNDHENLGIRMGTIPLEDSVYALLLILCNVTLFERFSRVRKALDV